MRKLRHFLVLLGAFKARVYSRTAFKVYSTTDGRIRYMRSTNAFYTQPDIRGQHWVVNYRTFATQKDRRRKIADLLLYSKFRTRTKTKVMEKDMLLCLLFRIALFDYYTVHHNCVMRTLRMTQIMLHRQCVDFRGMWIAKVFFGL